ncbi:hypothetical protein ACJ41O_006007 [Fusarium nematophilum]
MKFLQTIAAFLASSWSVALAADTAAWKSRNIYFVLTDRIARSASDGGGNGCGNLGNYCGGTFAGLESKLDYIRGMGFDAIWLTPVGIYVMVDVVANHMGSGNIADFRPEPLNQQSSYHSSCDIDYSNQNSVETCRIAGLPDVKTEDSQIRQLYKDWIKWLVTEFGFDGVRIDTVKHVEKDFWPGFASAAGVYTIGEVFDGNPNYLAGYANLMSGLLNYAIYYPMNRFYQQKGSAQDMVNMHNEVSSKFPDPSALGTFLDNHDNARWLNQKNDVSLLKNALAYVILSRGIPIVYYGTEQGYAGGNDPANREDLWRSGYNTNADLYQTISRLSGARKTAGGLAGNDHEHLYVTGDAYAWSRAGGNLIVLTTNRGRGTSGQHCFNSRRANKSWNKVFGGGSVSSNGDGQVCVDVTNGEPVVLVAS